MTYMNWLYEQNKNNNQKNKKQVGRLTLPEGKEDDRFDCEEFEHGFVRPEQVTSCKEEEEESVEGQTH